MPDPTTDSREIERLVLEGAQEGLARAGVELLRAGQADVPVGDPQEDPDPSVSLAASGNVEVYEHTVVVAFETAYAAKQHEAQHFEHPRGGRSKYLEANLKAVIPRLEGIVAGEVHKRMRGRRR